MAGITTWEGANAFLIKQWIPFHNQTWSVKPSGEGSAFVPYTGHDLDRIFALVYERVIGHDNCVGFKNKSLQIPQSPWRYSFAKCKVKVYEHLDGTISIGYGPHILGRFTSQGELKSTQAQNKDRGSESEGYMDIGEEKIEAYRGSL